MKTKPGKAAGRTFSPLGCKRWAVAEGYIPPTSHGPGPEMASHEAACVLNLSSEEARLEIWIFYSDRGPVGPYKISVAAQSTRHIRFNDLTDPEPIPLGTDYASLIESNIPVVVQHTRLDSRQSENALMTTMAYADAGSNQ